MLTTDKFVGLCKFAADYDAKKEALPTGIKRDKDDFDTGSHKIPIFRLDPKLLDKPVIVALIGNGSGQGSTDEPQFQAICRDNVPHPSHTGNSGDIDFPFQANVPVTIEYNLLPNLKHTFWKKIPKDSIDMVQFSEDTINAPKPTADKWPKCLGGKKVDHPAAPTISIQVKICPVGSDVAYVYKYTVHMDRTINGTIGDFSIDPFIFNRP